MRLRALIVTLVMLSCTNESDSRRALESSGFSEITTTGWEPFACSDSDDFSTGFRAVNPQGKSVKGVVCCGILKGCTVRF